MKRSLKQLGLATFAVFIIGAGVSGVALANNAKEGKEKVESRVDKKYV